MTHEELPAISITLPARNPLAEIAAIVATAAAVESATVEQAACIHVHLKNGTALVCGTVSGEWGADYYHDRDLAAPVGDHEFDLAPETAPAVVARAIVKAIGESTGEPIRLRVESIAGLPVFINGTQWAEEMHRAGLAYHIEDSPYEIQQVSTGERTFTDEQAELLCELCRSLLPDEAEAYFSRAVDLTNEGYEQSLEDEKLRALDRETAREIVQRCPQCSAPLAPNERGCWHCHAIAITEQAENAFADEEESEGE